MVNRSHFSLSARFTSVLGLQPGEGRLAATMAVYQAAISIVLVVGYKGVATALFLSTLPPSATPYLYILPAISVTLTLLLYNRVAARIRVMPLVLGSMALLFAITLAFWLLLLTPYGSSFVVLAGLFLFMEALTNLLNVQFWSFAGQLINLREARRLFNLFIGVQAAASIPAGALLGPLGKLLGTSNLLLVAELALLVAVVCVVNLGTRFRATLAAAETAGEATGGKSHISLAQTSRAIWNMPLLRAIAALTILLSLLFNTSAYQFSLAIQGTYSGQTQSVVAFLGSFEVWTRLAALVVQFCLASFVIRRLGVVATLLFYPLSVVLASVGALFAGGGLLPVAINNACGPVFRRTLHEAGVNILYLPLPGKLQRSAKELLGAVYALTFGIAGVIFLIIQNFNPVPYLFWSIPLAMLGLVLVGLLGWTRRAYVLTLASSIRHKRFDLRGGRFDLTDGTTLQVLAETLKQEEPVAVLHALDLIIAAPEVDWSPHVAPLLAHPTAEVRIRALGYLGQAGNSSYAEDVAKLLHDPEGDVRAAALEAYSSVLREEASPRIRPFLADSHLRVRSAAILCEARYGGPEGWAAAHDSLCAMLTSPDAWMRKEGVRVCGLLGRRELTTALVLLIDDADSQVRVEAIRAVGTLRDPAFVPRLAEKLGDKATCMAAEDALAGYGADILPVLGALLSSRSEDRAVRSRIPALLARIGGEQALVLLVSSLSEPDDIVRSQICGALRLLYLSRPDICMDKTVLRSALTSEVRNCYTLYLSREDLRADSGQHDLLDEALSIRLDRALERAFDLLLALHADHNLDQVRETLLAKGPVAHNATQQAAQQAQAIELLDNLVDREIRDWLVPLFEGSVVQVQETAKQRFSLKRQPSLVRLKELAAEGDLWLRVCALWRIGSDDAVNDLQLHGLVMSAMSDDEPLIRETAYVASQKLNKHNREDCSMNRSAQETGSSSGRYSNGVCVSKELNGEGRETPLALSTVERVLVLKRMHLFSHLPAEELIEIANLAEEVNFQAGERIIRQGELGSCLYITVEGDTSISIDGAGQVAVRPAPSVLGEMAIILRSPRSANCTALTEIAALKLDHEPFQQLLAEKPGLALEVMKDLAERLDAAQRNR